MLTRLLEILSAIALLWVLFLTGFYVYAQAGWERGVM